MPIRSRHIAAGTLLLDAAGVEPLDRIADFSETADLPGDLIDGDSRLLAAAESIAHALGEQDHGVVIRAVTGEIPVGVAEAGDLCRIFGAARVIHDIGDAKAEKVDIKMHAGFHVAEIEAEVAESSNLKGLVQEHAADVEFICRHRAPPKNIRPSIQSFRGRHNAILTFNLQVSSCCSINRRLWTRFLNIIRRENQGGSHGAARTSFQSQDLLAGRCPRGGIPEL